MSWCNNNAYGCSEQPSIEAGEIPLVRQPLLL